VRPEEAVLLNLGCAPESLLLTVLPVPPVCIRPSLLLNNNLSNEDDLTIKMREIFIFNKRLQNLVAEG
jgi:DNA-directed RNA polymerase beta' subunit